MATYGFEIDGLDELEKDLMKAQEEFPKEMRSELRKIANEFKRECIKKTPQAQHHRGNPKSALRKKYGTRTIQNDDETLALVFNSAPHFHLVEKGHELVKNGKTIGWVPGKHMMEQTRNEFAPKVPEKFEKALDNVLKKNGL